MKASILLCIDTYEYLTAGSSAITASYSRIGHSIFCISARRSKKKKILEEIILNGSFRTSQNRVNENSTAKVMRNL